MMQPLYQVSHSRSEETRIRVLLNDVPICAGKPSGHASSQETANELVVPGENVFLIEMAQAKWKEGAFKLRVWRDDEKDHRLVDFVWGSETPEVGEYARVPQVFARKFVADDVTRVPCFRKADRVDFGCEGLPEQVDLVVRLQRAVELKRVDEWLALHELQHREIYEAHYLRDGDHPATQRAPMEQFFAMPIIVRPFDPAELHFERRDEGRIAIVTRIDGSSPVEAISDGKDDMDFVQRLAPEVRMTRLEGRWQLF